MILYSYIFVVNTGFADGLSFVLISVIIGIGAAFGIASFILSFYPFVELSLDSYLKCFSRNIFLFYALPLVVIGAIHICSAVIRAQTQPIESLQLIVLGLDGASWDVIDPMIEQGRLPTIERLRDEGASGVLQSLQPMRSPLLWASIATGVSSATHGVSGFFSTRSDLKAPRFWDVARHAGLKIGLFRWMPTWPVQDEFAFVVPSWMARQPDAWPPSLQPVQEILIDQSPGGGAARQLYSLHAAIGLGANAQAIDRMAGFYLRDVFKRSELDHMADKAMSEIRLQTDVFLAQAERHDINAAAFVLYGSDQLGHRFWHHMQPEAFADDKIEADPQYANVIPDYYAAADRAFRRILDRAPEDAVICLLSDHGMKADTALPGQYFIDGDALLAALGYEGIFTHRFIERRWVVEAAPQHAEALQRLQSELTQLRFEGEEDPLFLAELESRRLTARANFSLTAHPDSPVNRHKRIVFANGTKAADVKRVFFERRFSGAHDEKGILLLRGPGIAPGARIEDADLLDIAPTLLYLLRLPLSDELEGRVLNEAIEEGFLNANPPERVDAYPPVAADAETPQGADAFFERLQSLGYVD